MKMKTQINYLILALALMAGLHTAGAQGTAFTYSGKLNAGSTPANGVYDLTFSVFNVNGGGSALAGPLTNSATGVTNGLFTVTLDFGSVFNGDSRWLEIGVRTNATGGFTTLAPRQPVTPTPYAIFANTASNLSGVLPAGQLNGTIPLSQLPGAVVTNNNTTPLNLTGTFAGNGGGLTNLPATGGAASNAWLFTGNNVTPGQFIGSVNSQPVEIWANNQRVAQLAYASNAASGYSPNVIFGSGGNYVSNGVVGATIVGGGVANGFYIPSTNQVSADFGTVVGGYGNTASGKYSLATGFRAVASGTQSTALGGASATGDYSTAAGNSSASGKFSTAAGNSTANARGATALGESTASNQDSTAMGASTANGQGSTAMGNSIAQGNYCTAIGEACVDQGEGCTVMGISNTVDIYGYGCTAMGVMSNARGIGSTAIGISTFTDGQGSFAAGNGSYAPYDGDFVWSDSYGPPEHATEPDQFLINASGGVIIDRYTAMHFGRQFRQMINLNEDFPLGDAPYGIGVQTSCEYFRSGGDFAWFRGGIHSNAHADAGGGVVTMFLDSNGNLGIAGAFYPSSDRNLKAGFEPVDQKIILEKVTALPITRWHFTNEVAMAHIGPMAQDFRAAFGLGMDDKHIATVDESGVALAAIQGLNEKVEIGKQKAETEIQKLEADNAELKQQNDSLAARLNELEAAVKSITEKK